MPGLNINNPSDLRVAWGKLKDGWTYDVERVPRTDRFCVTVVHPYGNEPSGGVPWPIEDPTVTAEGDNPAHPTYSTIEEAISAAIRYVDMLSDLHGYPDPDKMSPRGLRPAIW